MVYPMMRNHPLQLVSDDNWLNFRFALVADGVSENVGVLISFGGVCHLLAQLYWGCFDIGKNSSECLVPPGFQFEFRWVVDGLHGMIVVYTESSPNLLCEHLLTTLCFAHSLIETLMQQHDKFAQMILRNTGQNIRAAVVALGRREAFNLQLPPTAPHGYIPRLLSLSLLFC